MEPITIPVAESFEEVALDVVVEVSGPGTADGFLKLRQGEAAADAGYVALEDDVKEQTRSASDAR